MGNGNGNGNGGIIIRVLFLLYIADSIVVLLGLMRAAFHYLPSSKFGFWITISMYSLSGATMISCFFDRIRRNVKSFVGSRVRTALDARAASCVMSAACWFDASASRVDFNTTWC